MPSTQADVRRISLTGAKPTLGWTVSEASCGSIEADDRREVHDNTTLFAHPLRESLPLGVLRIDCVRDDCRDKKGTVGVDFEDLFEVLLSGRFTHLHGTMTHLKLVSHLRHPWTIGVDPSAVH